MKSSVGNWNLSTTHLDEVVTKISRTPRRMQWNYFRVALVIADALLVAAAFRLAYFVRFELGLPFFQNSVVPPVTFYNQLILALIPVWLLIFAANGLYRPENLLGGLKEYDLLFRSNAVGLLLVIVLGFLETEFIIARGWLLTAWASSFLLNAFGRLLLRRVVYNMRTRGYFLAPTIIVGANSEAFSLASSLMSWRKSGLYIVGFIDDNIDHQDKTYEGLRVLGTGDDLPNLIDKYQIQEVILATSALTRSDMLRYFQQYGVDDRISLRLSSGLFELITTGLSINEVAYTPLITVNKTRLTGFESLLKTVMDFAITLPALIVLSPLFLAIAAAIRFSSPGPIIHRRRVMGVNGRQFDAFKFRTMVINGDEVLNRHPKLKAELARNHKLKDDPRVTKIGKILRRLSLDELPQLFNVLKQDMSLIGPRMISPPEMEKYGRWGLNLLTVRPGITGLWQVSGRSDLDYDQRVQLDMQYIRRWNVWLDIFILFRTIPAVLKSRGAY